MSKASKKRQSVKRREDKKRRKLANYVRYGPKKGQISKKKKHPVVGEGRSETSPTLPKTATSAKARKRRRKNGTCFSVGGKRPRK